MMIVEPVNMFMVYACVFAVIANFDGTGAAPAAKSSIAPPFSRSALVIGLSHTQFYSKRRGVR